MLPQARGDELAKQALAVEDLLDRGDDVRRLGGIAICGDDVVVVKLHAVEAELPVLAQLGGEGDLLANGGTEGVGPHADVPRAEGEAIASAVAHGGESPTGEGSWRGFYREGQRRQTTGTGRPVSK